MSHLQPLTTLNDNWTKHARQLLEIRECTNLTTGSKLAPPDHSVFTGPFSTGNYAHAGLTSTASEEIASKSAEKLPLSTIYCL